MTVPKLNHFGIAFRNNGYRMPQNDASLVKQPDVALGSPAWKKQWPKNGVWPGAIADRAPVSFRLLLDTNIFGSGPQPHLIFDMPHEFALYAGGTLGSGISYFGEVEFKESATPILSQAYINFDHLAKTPLLNLRIGRFEPIATPFSRFYRRLTSSDYNVSEYLAFSDPSPGSFRFTSRQQGIELYGARTGPDNRGGLEWGVGVVNGSDSSRDTNTHKDIEWSASYKFFGYGVAGPIRQEKEEDTKTGDNFVDDSIKVGVFGVSGRRGIGTGPTATEDRYNRVGVKLDIFIKRLNVYGAYVRGKDRIVGANREFDSSAWFTEADYVLTPWIIPLIRYEKTDVTEIAGRPQPQERRVVPAVNLAIRANVRLLVEGRFFVRDANFPSSLRPRNDGRIRLDFLF